MNDDPNDLHRVRYIHEDIHDRLLNWARWCNGSGRSSSAAPMFRHYRAGYCDSTEHVQIPVDTLDAVLIEQQVGFLPEKHRDSLRWFYVYSHRGMGLWRALRALGLRPEFLAQFVHDGRSMLKNRLDRESNGAIIRRKFDSASAASASLREAEPSVDEATRWC